MSDNPTILHGPAETMSLWQEAMEAQIHGIKLLDHILTGMERQGAFVRNLETQWRVDRLIMQHATAFAWGADPLAAVLAAAQSMPGDTRINHWNLETGAAWWYFKTPLPVQTVLDPDAHVHAMSFGWIKKHLIKNGPPVPAFVATCWIPDPITKHDSGWRARYGNLMPSQVWTWFSGETLDTLQVRLREDHERIYAGRMTGTVVPADVFMHAANILSRVILAGFVWMNQKVLHTTDGALPRQRRKDYHRTVAHESLVKIVELRRAEHVHEITDNPEADSVQWTCRWEVDGHWRNQACGPNFSDRRVVWINPFVKGPAGLPMRVPKHKVYMVTR